MQAVRPRATTREQISVPAALRAQYARMSTAEKMKEVQKKVFGVTDEECQHALRLNTGDVLKAVKYLKVLFIF